MEETPVKIVKLDFTLLEFYDTYVVSSLFDEVIFDRRLVNELTTICIDHYGDQRFAYISNRIATYNVDPTIYLNLNKARFLTGIAVVSKQLSAVNMAHFERKFSTLPFEIFLEMEEAVEWVKKLKK